LKSQTLLLFQFSEENLNSFLKMMSIFLNIGKDMLTFKKLSKPSIPPMKKQKSCLVKIYFLNKNFIYLRVEKFKTNNLK
jgi:hypothetical protein